MEIKNGRGHNVPDDNSEFICSVFFRDYPGPYIAKCDESYISLDQNVWASNGQCVACNVVNGEGLESVLNRAWITHTEKEA